MRIVRIERRIRKKEKEEEELKKEAGDSKSLTWNKIEEEERSSEVEE
jgi:hypothetical protein